jgi:acyl carrier protein
MNLEKNHGDVDYRIKSIIARILKTNITDINDTSSPRSTPGWVGLNHRAIISSLEEEFNIQFDLADAEIFVNYKIIKATVLSYIEE